MTIKFIGVIELDNPNSNRLDVLANLVQERRSQVDRAGNAQVTDKRKDFRVDFELLYTGHAWSVVTIKIMK